MTDQQFKQLMRWVKAGVVIVGLMLAADVVILAAEYVYVFHP